MVIDFVATWSFWRSTGGNFGLQKDLSTQYTFDLRNDVESLIGTALPVNGSSNQVSQVEYRAVFSLVAFSSCVSLLTMTPPLAGLDPLKDLFEQILTRLDALEAKVGGAPPGGSLSGGSFHAGSSHGRAPPKGQKRLSVVHGEWSCARNVFGSE
jgi:hypothetical protein